MAAKRAFPKAKSHTVFGQARKQPKMFRAGLYARVSTNDQQFLANDMQLSRIPTDYQRRAVIRKPRRLANRRVDAVNGRYALGDRVQIGKPLLPLGIVIARYPRFHGRQKTQHFLTPDLVVAARPMMGRTGLPSRHEEIFAS